MSLTKQDLSAIAKIVKTEAKPVNSKLASIDKRLSKVETDLKTTIKFFDEEHLELKKRVENTENKLGIPAPEF